MVLDCLDLYY